MKIAIDCRMIGTGGIGSYISELIPHLLKNNECLLLGKHEQCTDFIRDKNVEFCYCDIKPFSLKEMIGFPKDILSKIHQYDVYFTPYCNIPGGISLPIFSTIHDVVFLDVPGLTGTVGKIARKFFYQRAINFSNGIFTVSEFSKQRIIAKLKCKKPIYITYNSVPSYLTKGDVISEKKDEILFVGNIKKHKGLKTLLDAYEIARQKGFSQKLVIVGNADNFKTGDVETVRRLEQMPKDSVVFTGKISNAALKELYAEAKLLVQPSLYEGFGIPPLEAMTMGTPVILSDIPVFKEIYNGFPVEFFEAGNAESLAEKLLSSKMEPVDIAKLKENGIGTEYSYEKSCDVILRAFANL